MKILVIFLLAVISATPSSCENDYVSKMIECDASSEDLVSSLYDVFLQLLTEKEIRKERLTIPESLAKQHLGKLIVSRSYYVTPNELRGFELVISKELFERKDGYLFNRTNLTLEAIETKQSIQILVLREGVSE